MTLFCDAFIEDFDNKVDIPETIRKGRRTFYCFE